MDTEGYTQKAELLVLDTEAMQRIRGGTDPNNGTGGGGPDRPTEPPPEN